MRTPRLPVGSRRGLLRLCTPVLVGTGSRPFVVWGLDDAAGTAALVAMRGSVVCDGCIRQDVLSVDLSDATGRMHALWYAANEMCGGTLLPEEQACVVWRAVADGWFLEAGPHRGHMGFNDDQLDLNATARDRRLPDGSAWVDAEAIARLFDYEPCLTLPKGAA